MATPLSLPATIDPKSMSKPALRAFKNIAAQWSLTSEEQRIILGGPKRSTFFKWKKEQPELSIDTLERLAHILAIYKNLHVLIPEAAQANSWIRRANKASFLNGKSALSHMLHGKVSDLFEIRNYLDAQRGGWA